MNIKQFTNWLPILLLQLLLNSCTSTEQVSESDVSNSQNMEEEAPEMDGEEGTSDDYSGGNLDYSESESFDLNDQGDSVAPMEEKKGGIISGGANPDENCKNNKGKAKPQDKKSKKRKKCPEDKANK
jgi:hypothetical protein